MNEVRWTKAHETLFFGYHKLSESDKTLYLILRLYANEHEGKKLVYPSQILLARQMGVSKRSIVTSVSRLASAKLIEKIPRTGMVNIYFIHDPSEDDKDYQEYLKWYADWKKVKSGDGKAMYAAVKYRLKQHAGMPGFKEYIEKTDEIKGGKHG